VRISGSNAGYTMFRGSVKGTGYPLHSPVSPSLPLPCVTVCHHISSGVYLDVFKPIFVESFNFSTCSLRSKPCDVFSGNQYFAFTSRREDWDKEFGFWNKWFNYFSVISK